MGKLKLNKDSLKGLFVNHVEKMVLGVVMLVFGVFVYTSLGLEGLPPGETPDQLLTQAKTARENIVNPANAEQVVSAVTVNSGYVQTVEKAVVPTPADLYSLTRPLDYVTAQEGTRRQDPTLFPPEKVEVYPLWGQTAHIPNAPDEDQLAKLKNSTPPKVEVKKKAPPKTKGGMGGESGMMGSGAEGMPGMPGMPGGGEMGMPGGAESGMPGLGMPGMGSGMAGGGMPGLGGSGATGGIAASPADRPGFVASMGAVPRGRTCIAVKAVVPWKKQYEEFEAKFSTSLGYDPRRDTPRYLSFTAERIEVSDDPAAPLDWSKATKIFTNKLRTDLQMERFAGFGNDVADPRYLQYGVLTMPVPPFMNRNLDPLALHSEVPKVSPEILAKQAEEAMKAAAEKKKKDDEKRAKEVTDDPGETPAAALPGGSFGAEGSSGMPGMPGGSGGMMPGMPGMPGGSGGMMPGMPGGSGGMMPGMGSGEAGMGMGMPGMGSGMAGMGMPGMGSEGMPGMPGMEGTGGMPGMGSASRGPAVPYLLVRFYDFNVEPGKKYRYRVQVIVEDPNHPQFPQMDPSDRYLDDSVKARVNGEVAALEKASKSKARQYYRRTEWSQPSDPVGVDIVPTTYAGRVAAAKMTLLPDKTTMPAEEPSAKIMSVVWDAVHSVDVSHVSEVARGTYLNFEADGDAIHPVMLVFKLMEKFQFVTNHMVADIRGGEELTGGDKDHPLLAPGQYALIDENGQIRVRNEFDDWDQFRKLTLPEAPEMPSAAAGGIGEMGGMGGMDGMMPGMPGMPGGSGGKKGKTGRGARGGGSSSVAP